MSISQKISTSTQPLSPRLTTTHGLLFQDDCMNVLARVKSESIATVFADPPFNLGKRYNNGFEDSWDEKEYLEWSANWIAECCRILRPGGAFFIYALPRLAYLFAARLDEALNFRHWIALSMKSTYPRGKRLYPAHYALLYFTKGNPRVFNKIRVPTPVCRHCKKEIKDYGGYRKLMNPEGISLSDFWEDTSPNRHRQSKARWGVNELKPIIPARAIELSTDSRDVVFDPFGGGGSTYQEAQRLDRYWIGSEIGDCAPIVQRIKAFAPTTIDRNPPKELQDCLE
jgi:site-specific DNA-methyltransferase (adenine-specific)